VPQDIFNQAFDFRPITTTAAAPAEGAAEQPAADADVNAAAAEAENEGDAPADEAPADEGSN